MSRHATGPRLEKSPAGYWEIRWTEGRSRRKSTGTTDLDEAQQKLAAFIFQRGKSAASAPPVSLVLESYLEEKGVGEREAFAAGPLKRLLGDVEVDALTADRIRSYTLERADSERPVSPSTVRRELAVLIAAINHAHKQRRLNAALLPVIELPPESTPRTEIFEPEQIDFLIAMTAPADGERMSRIHRFIWLAAETASRRAAVESLRWDQIDLEGGKIRYHRAGDKVTKKRRVTVPISIRLRPALWRMKAERTEEFVLDSDAELYQAWVSLMKRAAEKSNDASYLDKVPHDLRRSWATFAARAGVSMFDIAGVLGDSLDVVTKHYAHQSPNHLYTAVNFRQSPQ